MPNGKEWVGVFEGDFPCLRELHLDRCPINQKLPTIPNEVVMLDLTDCACHEIQFSKTRAL